MKRPSFIQKILIFVVGFILYYVAGYSGLELATINNFASPIWPAAGIAVGMTFLFGYWVAPAFLLSSMVLNSTESPNYLIPLFIGIGCFAEAMAARYLLRRFILKNTFKDYSELIAVILTGAITSSISATIAVLTLHHFGIIGEAGLGYTWYTWWSGDAIGILMLMPLTLELRRKNFYWLTFPKITEAAIGGSLILTVLYLCFIKDLNQAFLWLGGPAFILLGIRCGRLNTSIVFLIVSCFVATLTVMGYGPFQYGNTNRNLIYIQTLITGFSLCVLFIRHMKTWHEVRYTFVIALLSCAGILFVLTYFTTYYEKKNTLDDYTGQIESALNSIEKTSNQYNLVMNGTSGAFRMSTDVEKDEWKSYVDSILPATYFESVNGLGYIARVKKSETEKHLKTNKLKLTVLDESFSELYDDRLIITYIEPMIGNFRGLGLDIGSEEKRRTAAEAARRLHKTVATDPITLLQDKDMRKGYLIFHPTYNKAGEFIGWTYAPVVGQVFFGKTLDYLNESLRMRISINGEEFYSSEVSVESFKKDSFYFTKDLMIFGKTHKIEIYPTDLFFRRHSDYSVAIPLILNLFVLIIAALGIEQMTFGLRAEALIAERTKELDISKMQLVESSKMASLGEMASGMAHEINNPLTIIQGKLQVIQMILGDLNVKDKALFEEISKIRTTTDRIEKIVKGLRNFSRAANHDPFELTALKPIVTETLDLCAEKIRAEGIKLNVSEIPKLSIRCRPAQLSQVLINLLNNSRDAISDSTVKWIDLAFKVTQDKVQIIITDSGPGIPPEVAERMMEPFFTTKEVGKGTGLGLSISKGIIAGHGGKLWLDTNSINTRFIIELRYYT